MNQFISNKISPSSQGQKTAPHCGKTSLAAWWFSISIHWAGDASAVGNTGAWQWWGRCHIWPVATATAGITHSSVAAALRLARGCYFVSTPTYYICNSGGASERCSPRTDGGDGRGGRTGGGVTWCDGELWCHKDTFRSCCGFKMNSYGNLSRATRCRGMFCPESEGKHGCRVFLWTVWMSCFIKIHNVVESWVWAAGGSRPSLHHRLHLEQGASVVWGF